MANSLNDNLIGAILEYAYLYKNNDQRKIQEWCTLNNISPHKISFINNKFHLNEIVDIYTKNNGKQAREKLYRAIKKLEEYQLLEADPEDDDLNTPYRIISLLGEELFRSDVYMEYLYGGKYIIDKWKTSIARIYITGVGIGTGFYIGNKYLVTAKHVVEGLQKENTLDQIIVQFENGGPHYSIVKLHNAEIHKLDLIILELDSEPNVKAFKFQTDTNILEPIIIIGYPSIPTAADAYQVVSSGEISSLIEKYDDEFQYMLVSVNTYGGHSGAPIINRRGEIIGIITGSGMNVSNVDDEHKLNKSSIGFSMGLYSYYAENILKKILDSNPS